jgi:CheY-like chemotaxis protein
VDSQLGEGSTFWFSARFGLAAAAAPTPADGRLPALAAPGGIDTIAPGTAEARRARVLVVDDNEVNLLIAGEMLSHAGAEVHTAEDGAKALQRLQSETFDLVFMDMQMPVMDGLQATREIRRQEAAQPAGARVPVIALTANLQPGVHELCQAAGIDDVLHKPVDFELLRERLAHWLRRAQSVAV